MAEKMKNPRTSIGNKSGKIQPAVKQKKKSRNPFIIVMVVMVLLFFGIVAFAAGVYLKFINMQTLAAKLNLQQYPVIGQYFAKPKTNFKTVNLPGGPAQNPNAVQPQTPAKPGNAQAQNPLNQGTVQTQAPLNPGAAAQQQMPGSQLNSGMPGASGLVAPNAQLQKLQQQQQQQAAMRVSQLAQIYDGMKPSEVVPILNQMNDTMVLEVFAKMDPSQVSQIMAAMNPQRVAKLSKMMINGK
jgi:hypothetical protein